MKQLKYMRQVSREFPDKIGDVSNARLPESSREQMKAAIAAGQNGTDSP